MRFDKDRMLGDNDDDDHSQQDDDDETEQLLDYNEAGRIVLDRSPRRNVGSSLKREAMLVFVAVGAALLVMMIYHQITCPSKSQAAVVEEPVEAIPKHEDNSYNNMETVEDGATSPPTQAPTSFFNSSAAVSNTTTTLSPTVATTSSPTMSAETVPPTSSPVASPTHQSMAPTPAQTVEQTTITYDIQEDPLYTIHLPFGDDQKQYRRVCSPVHSSLLCLTVLYPNPFEPQDPAYSYPHPVDEQVYDYDPEVFFMDGLDLQTCRDSTLELESLDERVVTCLAQHAQARQEPTRSVVGIWTKGPSIDQMEFYGVRIREKEQKARIDSYFEGHIVMILGDSTGPIVTNNMKNNLFTKCLSGAQIKPSGSSCNENPPAREVQVVLNEDDTDQRDLEMMSDVDNNIEYDDILNMDGRNLGNAFTWGQIPDSARIFVGSIRYHPVSDDDLNRAVPKFTIPEMLNQEEFARTNRKKRKISFVVLHPLAHTQSHRTMTTNRQQIDTAQTVLTNYIMQVRNSEEGRKLVSQAGYELGHILAFDGRPQFFPTSTGGYGGQPPAKTEEAFVNGEAFEGWQPDWGSRCRGPLPSNSPLKKVLAIARRAYEAEGLDMRFYGRTWEFNNLFWYAVQDWKSRTGLDCTHSIGFKNGLERVTMYPFMAMIDDHFDQLEAEK